MFRLNAFAGLAPVSQTLIALTGSLLLVACGGGGSVGSGGSGGAAPDVTVTPAAVSLAVGGGTQTFSATVTGSSNTAVTWQVNGTTGGGPTVGTISTAGVYSAPPSVPAGGSVTVSAVSVADPSKSASAIVTLMPPVGGSPTVPGALQASAISSSGVTLTWTASSDSGGPGIGGYYVYRDGTQIASVASGTTYTDSALTAATTYGYQVAAFDTGSPPNVSALTPSLKVLTLSAAPDTQAPTVPTGLAVTSNTSTAVALSWNASTDQPVPGATGVGGYELFRNGTLLATVSSGTTYNDTGVSALTTYSYRVAAFDKATPPNLSAQSAPLSVTTPGPLTVTPHNAQLTLGQSQQFATNAPSGTALTWSVDGTAGGNGSVGTVSSAGVYTPPSSGGTHTLTVAATSNTAYSATAAIAVTNLQGILTYQSDLARTGQNPTEYALTPAAVRGGSFGKRWSCPLDGAAYAQPLYVPSLAIGGGTHNVLFVATMHDSIYAFDADNPNCVTYWHVSLVNAGETSTSDASTGCPDVLGEFGVNGTPVIDLNSKTIYAVSNSTGSGTVYQRLHALKLATGAEPNPPTVIQASVNGNGDGGTTVDFNAISAPAENQRAGLVLSGGGVFVAFGSHCDTVNWHGWVMRYDEVSLNQTAVLNVTPNGAYGGIWMSGAAPAVDSGGNMFLSTGNGDFTDTSSTIPALEPNNNFGESFLKLNTTSLAVQDFYTPSNYASWNTNDLDISAGGVVVIPDGAGPGGHRNLLVGIDKQGHIWSIDRSSMSGYVPGFDNTVQYLTLPSAGMNSVHNAPAYWNGNVYVAVGGGPLMALQFTGGLLPNAAGTAIAASHSAESYGYPPPTPTISYSPSGNAIVWALDNQANGTDIDDGAHPLGPAILRAYDANNLADTLYSSSSLPADTAGNATKFTLPVVANGHVYVGGDHTLTVYGLAP